MEHETRREGQAAGRPQAAQPFVGVSSLRRPAILSAMRPEGPAVTILSEWPLHEPLASKPVDKGINTMATKSNELGAEMDRCPWAKTDLYVHYHDTEWGVPVHDDRLLFEFLILEGAQAGLSWETILNKRKSYRAAFDHFDPASVAKYGKKKRKNLLSDSGIVRNR